MASWNHVPLSPFLAYVHEELPFVIHQHVSQATPKSHQQPGVMGPPTVEQPSNTYSLVHTRPALLKQLDDVKVRITRGLLLLKNHIFDTFRSYMPHLVRTFLTKGKILPNWSSKLLIAGITSIKVGDLTRWSITRTRKMLM